EHAIERAGAAVRHGLPELDLGVAGARIVFLLGGRQIGRGERGGSDGAERGDAELAAREMPFHAVSPYLGHCADIAARPATAKSSRNSAIRRARSGEGG